MLVPYLNDDIEIVIDTESGEAFASQRATARMCDVSEAAIRKRLVKTVQSTKSAKIPTTTNKTRHANLLNEQQIMDCLQHYNPLKAQLFLQVGVRAGLHRLAGYKPSNQITQTALLPANLQDALSAIKEIEQAKREILAEKQAIEATLEQVQPLLSVASDFLTSEGAISFSELAKILQVGRNRLLAYLRLNNILTKKNLPLDRYLQKDFFLVKEEKGLFAYTPITLVKPKGQAFVAELVADTTNPYYSVFDENKLLKEMEKTLAEINQK